MVTDPPYIPSGASAVKLTSISQFAPAANEVGQALAEIANAPPATMLEISNGDPPVFERMRGLDGHRRLRLCWYVRFTGERLAIGAVPVITLAVVVLELFAKLGSVEVEVTVAVSLSDVPLARHDGSAAACALAGHGGNECRVGGKRVHHRNPSGIGRAIVRHRHVNRKRAPHIHGIGHVRQSDIHVRAWLLHLPGADLKF